MKRREDHLDNRNLSTATYWWLIMVNIVEEINKPALARVDASKVRKRNSFDIRDRLVKRETPID
jgi:hypothetical protein